MTDNNTPEQFGLKLNNLQSSLKFFNFEGMDKEKIQEKYEEVLVQREKQIRDIAYEIGIINEKLCTSSDRIKYLEDENQVLHNRLLKKNTLLDQELTNKDIMFIKLNNLQNENDRLMKILQENGIGMTTNTKDRKSFFSGLVDKFGNKKEDKTNLNCKTEENRKNSITKSISMSQSVINNSNITSSISSTITQDLLNNIDLGSVSLTNDKSEKISNGNNTTTSSSNNSKTNPNNNYKNSNQKNPYSRGSGGERKLASESMDYEPVFK